MPVLGVPGLALGCSTKPTCEPHMPITEPHTEPRRLGWGAAHGGARRVRWGGCAPSRREGRAGREHGLVAVWSNDAATKNLASLGIPAAADTEPAELSR